MPCIFDIKPKNRHCQYCSAICDERQPKPIETLQQIKLNNMTDKLELKSSHEVVYTVDVADVNSIFYCKPTDPDILTVLMKDGKRLYCDEVCPVDSLQEEPISEELEEELSKLLKECEVDAEYVHQDFLHIVARHFANWQKEQFEKDCADLCNGIATAKGLAVTMAYDKGIADAREQMMANATEVTVHIDAGGYPYTPEIELYDYDKDVPLAKEGDKYKVVLIKEV